MRQASPTLAAPVSFPISPHPAYSLDKLGNWEQFDNNGTEDVRQHNAANEITARDVDCALKAVEYDDAGNLVKLDRDAGETTQRLEFAYDYRNRLVGVKEDGSGIAAYFYDTQNRRTKKYLTGIGDVVYLYDGWRCVEEREWDENGEHPDAWEPRRQYVYGGIYIDEPLIFDKDSGTDGVCETRYFYCQQANYNVVAMADPTGASVETVTYDPYGQPTLSGTATGNPLLFQGQRYDAESGLYYFRNRYYSPVLGRFVQRDPMGYGHGVDSYEFASSRVLDYVDPFGLWEGPNRESTQNRANVCAEEDQDPILPLAQEISLNEDEAFGPNGWLMTKEGDDVNRITDIKKGHIYTVPNTAYIDVSSYEFAFLKAALVSMKVRASSSAKQQGLKVVYTRPVFSGVHKDTILLHLGSRDVYYYLYIGHGIEGLLMRLADVHDYSSDQYWFGAKGTLLPGKYTKYGIARLALMGCESDQRAEEWRMNVSRYGTLVLIKGIMSAWRRYSFMEYRGELEVEHRRGPFFVPR